MTENDDYNKIYPFIIGSILLKGGICALVLIKEYGIFLILMTLNGLLLIVSGILFIPNGGIWVKNEKLISVSGNQKNNIEIKKLSEIKLFSLTKNKGNIIFNI